MKEMGEIKGEGMGILTPSPLFPLPLPLPLRFAFALSFTPVTQAIMSRTGNREKSSESNGSHKVSLLVNLTKTTHYSA